MDTARKHWWIVAVGLLSGFAGGAAILATGEPAYESSTSVLVADVGEPPNLATEAQLAASTATAADAARLLASATPPDRLVEGVAVLALADTSVLRIRYTATTPLAAQAGSRAFAQAYLTRRAASARSAIAAELAAVNAKLRESTTALAATIKRIADLPATSPELANLRSGQATLVGQIDALTTRANALATTTVTPGSIISAAYLPATPVRPDPTSCLGGGAALGLLLGVAAAIGRDRLGRRVRHGLDISRRAGVPVLAQLRADEADRAEHLRSTRGPGGRSFNRLRNEVVASLAPDDRVILVTGVSPGPAGTIVAANLAAALARAGNGVILVGANVPEIGVEAVALSQLFDVADVPGLTDALAHRVSLFRTLQRAPRVPQLRVVTPGGTASATGLLQTEAVRTALNALRHQAAYVVVEAPSAASGADAQSLAGVADAAILVAELGLARHDQVADAADQILRVGARLLGAVVLPRLPARAPAPDPADFRPMHRAEDGRPREHDTWVNRGSRATDAEYSPAADAAAMDGAAMDGAAMDGAAMDDAAMDAADLDSSAADSSAGDSPIVDSPTAAFDTIDVDHSPI